jgi:hypothetical protein
VVGDSVAEAADSVAAEAVDSAEEEGADVAVAEEDAGDKRRWGTAPDEGRRIL